jgi:excisionase family DNA binding protein
MSGDRVRYLTVAEVAEMMRLSRMTVYRLVHGGELPAVRVGRSFRVPQDALEAYLAASSVETEHVDRGRLSS